MSEARDRAVIEESRRQIERLAKLGWYHSIELPDGSVIPGHQSIEQQRRRLAQFHIPDDLHGKRVLDIGAWDGWFSFEMERRGAAVLAVDAAKNTRLLEAKRLLSSKIDYHVADITRLTWREVGTFDIVLFLGVLYHVKHPVLALENVCGMTREMACIESFVSDASLDPPPSMEFYETTELRGQLDNWVGPNAQCLLAFCRTAGFARVVWEGALGERGHVTGYRKWNSQVVTEPAPEILCLENSTSRDHQFSGLADDYVTIYFRAGSEELNCDTVLPEVGGFGSRPIYVARSGEGWQATFKLPLGLGPGWHDVTLRTEGTAASEPVRIGIDVSDEDRRRTSAAQSSLRMTRIADGKTFEDNRIRVGDDSAISVWGAGLPATAAPGHVRLRLNGTDLPAIWIAPAGTESRQINALLPPGIAPGRAVIRIVTNSEESAASEIELFK